MSWLPALCLAGNRYWLPMSRPAADLIAAVLIDQQAADKSLVSDLATQLRSDPPLAIFAALQLAAAPSCAGLAQRTGLGSREPATNLPCGTDDLPCGTDDQPRGTDDQPTGGDCSSEWLAQRCLEWIPHWFASGDRVLGVPPDRVRFVPQWLALQESFIAMRPSRWLAEAGQWLELTGPPIPAMIRQHWPSIADESAAPSPLASDVCASHFTPIRLNLSQLARKLNRERVLSGLFGDAVCDAKQAALKQLAYGLSHEINNPLANISVRAQGLMREEGDANRKASLQRVVDQAMRAHEMVADLMFFSHPPDPHRTAVNLNAVLAQVANQIGATVGERGIDIRISHTDPTVTLTADRTMMAEAARALIRNAVEAIGCDGQIDVQCLLQIDGGTAVASIVVRDSGPGLSEAAQQHAFDPYFSGREAGRGLGVGLCRVKRIAELHSGGVSLTSGPAGCIARLWIPAHA